MVETAIAGKPPPKSTKVSAASRPLFACPILRDSVEDIRELQVSSPDGPRIPLKDLASVNVVEGPALINRSMGKRRIVVGVNVQGRDLGGYVEELQEKVERQVTLPPGYFIEWGGQFHNMERALHHLMISYPSPSQPSSFCSSCSSVRALRSPHHHCAAPGIHRRNSRASSFPANISPCPHRWASSRSGASRCSTASCSFPISAKLREEGMSQTDAVREGASLRFRPVMMTATVAASA